MSTISEKEGQWYIIHTYSGQEERVQKNLEQRIASMDFQDKIFRVVVPTEEEIEIKEGRRRSVRRKVFPGYILVQMSMDDDSWHVVRNTPKVTGFVGTGTNPVPLTADEVARIVNQVSVAAEKPKPIMAFSVGETVRIVDGPFSNFTGNVEEVNEDRSTLKVMVTIFGRATPVELEFLQVEKP